MWLWSAVLVLLLARPGLWLVAIGVQLVPFGLWSVHRARHQRPVDGVQLVPVWVVVGFSHSHPAAPGS